MKVPAYVPLAFQQADTELSELHYHSHRHNCHFHDNYFLPVTKSHPALLSCLDLHGFDCMTS